MFRGAAADLPTTSEENNTPATTSRRGGGVAAHGPSCRSASSVSPLVAVAASIGRETAERRFALLPCGGATGAGGCRGGCAPPLAAMGGANRPLSSLYDARRFRTPSHVASIDCAPCGARKETSLKHGASRRAGSIARVLLPCPLYIHY